MGIKKFERPAMKERKRTSQAEDMFEDRAAARGWTVLRDGWPDYLLVREVAGGLEFRAVEVKRNLTSDQPKPGQSAVMAALEQAGVRCYIWGAHEGKLRRFGKCVNTLRLLLDWIRGHRYDPARIRQRDIVRKKKQADFRFRKAQQTATG